MERHYETVWIVRPDAGDEIIKGIIGKASSAVETGGGKINKVEEWGRRRLAYTIQKRHEGYYVIMDYVCGPEAGKELERSLKYNEDVMRYQTVRITRREEVAKAAAAAKKEAVAAKEAIAKEAAAKEAAAKEAVAKEAAVKEAVAREAAEGGKGGSSNENE